MSRRALYPALVLLASACTHPEAPQLPDIESFDADPATINAGESTRLTWDVSGATTISISTVGAVTGTSVSVTPAATTTYTLTATNALGSVLTMTTVTVRAAPESCGNGRIDPGEQCDPSASPPIPAGTNCPSVDPSFSGGTLSCSPTCMLVTSGCTAAMPPLITSFTATPTAITAGKSVTLQWTVTGASTLTISGLGAVTGTMASVAPVVTTTYTLTATNSSGSTTADATVTVASPDGGGTDAGPSLDGSVPEGPYTTYYGGTGSGSLVGAPVTQAVPQSQPSNIPLGTILFVTQVPMDGFGTISSSFSNHGGSISSAPRGGDLMLMYPGGALRYLTQEAGYGDQGMQGANAIAVRDPCVHWSGTKAVFSMVIGSPARYATTSYYWQVYEVTGLGMGETASITQVANQPQNVNNVSPFYGTDGRILFTSDLVPFDLDNGRLDEYETAPATTGLWSLDPTTGDLKIIFNSPSGMFNPMIDSFGRILWTNWDHLQRDQQADTNGVLSTYNPVDCTDEKDNSTCVNLQPNPVAGDSPPSIEVFPEPRIPQTTNPTDYNGHAFNQFFPWMIDEDGSGAETLNHIGEHEFGTAYQPPSFANDPTLTDISAIELDDTSLHANTNYLRGFGGLFHLAEDPNTPGRYYWHYAPEFHSMNGGDLGYTDADPSVNATQMKINLLTNTGIFPQEDATQDGHYRDPLPLSDGTLVAVYTSQIAGDSDPVFTAAEAQQQAILADGGTYGGEAAVAALYDYHLVQMDTSMMPYTAGTRLTNGITKTITWYDPNDLDTYDGPLWELQPVEVRARTIPARHQETTYPATGDVFQEAGVDESTLQTWLVANNLALITSFNVTQRDAPDTLQPFNLEVKDPQTGTVGASSTVGSDTPRDISYIQFLEGDALRSYRGYSPTSPVENARRIVAEYVTDTRLSTWFGQNGAPVGSVALASDGSMAAFVPAQKPLSWQLLDPNGNPVVRERYWLTFAAGEIRACTNCHGINEISQTGAPPPMNEPEALRSLLMAWSAAQ